jgi:hypothetical protein
VTPLRPEEAIEVGASEVLALEHHRCIEEPRRTRVVGSVDRAPTTARKRRTGGEGQPHIRGARRGGVVRLEGGEERDLADRPRREGELR